MILERENRRGLLCLHGRFEQTEEEQRSKREENLRGAEERRTNLSKRALKL